MASLNRENKLEKYTTRQGFSDALMRWLYEIAPTTFDMSVVEDISCVQIADILRLT